MKKYLSESQLRRIIRESIYETMSEDNMDEGFADWLDKQAERIDNGMEKGREKLDKFGKKLERHPKAAVVGGVLGGLGVAGAGLALNSPIEKFGHELKQAVRDLGQNDEKTKQLSSTDFSNDDEEDEYDIENNKTLFPDEGNNYYDL